jgi:hypothetical protein
MVIGAPAEQYQYESYRWQLYEVTGLGVNDTPVITKVTNQPAADQIINLAPKRIIFNPGTENPILANRAKAAGIATIEACTLVMLTTGQY